MARTLGVGELDEDVDEEVDTAEEVDMAVDVEESEEDELDEITDPGSSM